MSKRFFLILTIFWSVHQWGSYAKSDNEEYLAISGRVQNYFAALNSSNWLANSNKIGMGYNPLYGSPVCYTSSCQMEGFRRSIFKLQYLQPAIGSCTNKLIPEYVQLDCLPSATWNARTETIRTLQQLKESIMNKVGISVGGVIEGVLFSYRTSIETRYMVDNIIQKERTTMQTAADVSHVKLSMFEPQMVLSDDFKFVIDNLPCCSYNTAVQQYIYEYVFNYFGFTYLSEILLGGIAQETLFMTNDSYERIQSQGYSIENQAQVEFFLTVGASHQYNYDTETHNQFMSQVQEKHTTILGGDASITKIDEWLATVPSNPVITKFSIRNILTLLSQGRFPNDSLIQNKSELIARALNDYLVNPVYCYNNCTNHGICVPSSYFQFGICNCTEGYSGFDCSIPPSTAPPIAPPPSAPKSASSGTVYTFYDVRFAIFQFSVLLLFFFPLL